MHRDCSRDGKCRPGGYVVSQRRWDKHKWAFHRASLFCIRTRGDGVLIVNFDEAATSDTTYGGGHVAPVLWGQM